MRGKELIHDIINTYFMLVTMISVVMTVLGELFLPDASFGYEAFATPLVYAAYGTLPNIIMYAKKELTVRQFLMRKTIQLVLVEVIVIAVVVPEDMMTAGKTEIVVSLAISIFVVFMLTHLIEWFQNWAVAKQMTDNLMVFQRTHQ